MFKRFFSSLVLVATVALYGCGGGGSSPPGTPPPGGFNLLKSIAVSPASPVSMAVGDAPLQFTATGTYTVDPPTNITSSVAWSSADPSIATIDATGKVTAVKVGTTTITATSETISGTITLTVTAPIIPIIPVTGTTLAGLSGASGFVNDTGSSARFKYSESITTDGVNLYVADTIAVRKVEILTGIVTTIAGSDTSGSVLPSVDGVGPAARFESCNGITIAPNKADLYVTDGLSNTIRKVVISTGQVTTIAGLLDAPGSSVDSTGTAARFYQPAGITTDGTNLYVCDFGNKSIRKIEILSGAVTTVVASFGNPRGITMDGANLYVTDSVNQDVFKIAISTGTSWTATLLAGLPGSLGFADGTGTDARFNNPLGVTTDGTNLYVADFLNGSIRKVDIHTGAVISVTIQNKTSISKPLGITMIGATLYTSNNDFTIKKIQ